MGCGADGVGLGCRGKTFTIDAPTLDGARTTICSVSDRRTCPIDCAATPPPIVTLATRGLMNAPNKFPMAEANGRACVSRVGKNMTMSKVIKIFNYC